MSATIAERAERAVLGIMLIDGKALARVNGLSVADFSTEQNRRVYQAISDCWEEGLVDLVTVGSRLADNGGADLMPYAAALAEDAPSPANIERYAALMGGQSAARAREAALVEVADILRDPAERIEDRKARALAKLDAIDTPRSAPGWPESLDLTTLANTEPSPPKFIMEDWLPCGYATLLSGHGGVGKSGIALHLAVCIAAGVSFFGTPVERRRVLYMSCEDRTGVLHWRLRRICNFIGLDLASLSGWLEVIDLVGHDVVLWERDPRTGYTVTPAFGWLAERVKEHATEVLFVDGISDTYGGSGGSKVEVKRYVNAIIGLLPAEGVLMLIGHIDKRAAREGAGTEGYDGTTGWHNAVRARWYLYPETQQDDDGGRPERTGELTLELQKTNHGRINQQMRFRWDDGAHLFIGQAIGASAFDRKHHDREEQQGILRAFKGCAAAGIIVPSAAQGSRTAHNVLSLRPEFPDSLKRGKQNRARFWRKIEELRQIRTIEPAEYRRANGHKAEQLHLTTEGERQIAAFEKQNATR